MPVNDIETYLNQGTVLSSEDSGFVSYTNKPDTSSNIDLSASGISGNVSAPIYSIGTGSTLETTDFGFTASAADTVNDAFLSALETVQGASENTALALKYSSDLALKGKNTGNTSKLLTVVVVGVVAIIALIWGLPKILGVWRK